MNAVALPTTVADLIEEYETKISGLDAAIAEFGEACTALDRMTTVQGNYVERVFQRPTLYPEGIRKNLLKSGWRAVARRLQVETLMSANDKKLWEQTMADPPPLTMDSAKATFGDYLLRARFHALRALAEVFTSLDPAYKSHSKVKIGVKGLPKRVILPWGDYASGYGFDKFRDIVNALAVFQRNPLFDWSERSAIDVAHGLGEDAVLDGRKYVEKARRDWERDKAYTTVDRGLTIRKFGNGNAHIFFSPEALLLINRALAEFYGEVLPDVEPEDVRPSASTAVSKDLQFYWSPPAVVEAALEYAEIHTRNAYRYGAEVPSYRVLEPSCGDGRILDELASRGCRSYGIEYHPQRAAEARAKGHSVLTANFLETVPTGDFDKVVMNPPFYGKHYAKHVRHALKFLKPGGTLVAILPATARYDHDELADLVTREREQWRDLPVASFAEAGTNVPTTMLRVHKRA